MRGNYAFEIVSGEEVHKVLLGLETDIEIELRLLPQQFRGYDVGITEGRDLSRKPLRRPRVEFYMYIYVVLF
jgi:hypothetical protein